METPPISKRQFNRIRRLLPARKHKNLLDKYKVLNAIILVIKYGLRWRHIPDFFGKWYSIYSKFRRWSKAGIIKKIFTVLTSRLPKRCVAMLDSTYIKVKRTAASMRSDGLKRELGRSRGGMTTKIHVLCNDQGKPMDFTLSGGEVADIKIAPTIVERNKMKWFLADRAYNADALRQQLKSKGISVCIPAKSNRKNPEPYDPKMYKKTL